MEKDDLRAIAEMQGRQLTEEELAALARRVQEDHLDRVLNGERG